MLISKTLTFRINVFKFAFGGICLIIITFLYKGLYWDILLNTKLFLPGDNAFYHLPIFSAMSIYARFFHAFPAWLFTDAGGLWIESSANSFLILMPHRLMALYLSTRTDISINTLYKMSFLIIGHGLFLGSIYLVSRSVFHSRSYAWSAVVLSLLTSGSISLIHQEQSLASIFFIPLIWWTVLKMRKNGKYLLLFASLAGISLNHHHPHLILGYTLAVVVSLLIAFTEVRKHLDEIWDRVKRGGPWLLISAFACFLISSSPLIYTYTQMEGKLYSPWRGQMDGLVTRNLDDYKRLRGMGAGSVHPQNLRAYLGLPKDRIVGQNDMDRQAFFVTPALAFVLILLIFQKTIPFRRFHLSICGILTLAIMGVYGPMPEVLWKLMPKIGLFRQYYHFVHFLNFHLIFMLLTALNFFINKRYSAFKPKSLYWIPVGILTLLALTGLLSPVYGLIPAVLMAIKPRTDTMRLRKLILTCLLFLWIVPVCALWSRSAIKFYEGTIAEISPERPSDIAYDMPFDTQYLGARPRRLLIAFKDADYTRINQLISSQRRQLFVYADKSGNLLPGNKEDLAVKPVKRGMQVDLVNRKAEAQSVYFLQYNDGFWTGKDSSDRAIELKKTDIGIVEVPLVEGMNSFTIIRKHSIWQYLIVIMWLPAVISMGLAARLWPLRRFRWLEENAPDPASG